MATIGGISCTFIHPAPAEPESAKVRVRTWTRPGMSGEAGHLIGYGPAQYRYTCVLKDTKANVLTWCRAIEALVGSIVTIVDDFQDTYTNLLIKGASQPIRTPAYIGASQLYRGEITVWGTQQ